MNGTKTEDGGTVSAARAIARHVQRALKQADVTQVRVAETLDRSQGYVSERITGKSAWNVDELEVINREFLHRPSALALMIEAVENVNVPRR